MNNLMKWTAAATLAGLLAACGGSSGSHPGTIAEEAKNNNLTALLAAVTKAGLASNLSAANANLTVFAPTDAAFNTLATQLGFADATAMVNALSAADLSKILQYHLLSSTKSAADLKAGSATQNTAYTYESKAATLSLNTSSGVAITDAVLTEAKVSAADVRASNGIVHVVDKVLVPPGVLNVVQMAQVNPVFSSLVSNVVKANLATTLSGTGPFTVFAPTNDAFAAASATVATLNNTQLGYVLKYHVLGSQVLASGIPFGAPVATLNTNLLTGASSAAQTITINNSPLRITDTTASTAAIAATDVRASNGVIHVIGKVLIPN
jgi:uncharacterized surface protein with fasciclin (FAS1) repeats